MTMETPLPWHNVGMRRHLMRRMKNVCLRHTAAAQPDEVTELQSVKDVKRP